VAPHRVHQHPGHPQTSSRWPRPPECARWCARSTGKAFASLLTRHLQPRPSEGRSGSRQAWAGRGEMLISAGPVHPCPRQTRSSTAGCWAGPKDGVIRLHSANIAFLRAVSARVGAAAAAGGPRRRARRVSAYTRSPTSAGRSASWTWALGVLISTSFGDADLLQRIRPRVTRKSRSPDCMTR